MGNWFVFYDLKAPYDPITSLCVIVGPEYNFILRPVIKFKKGVVVVLRREMESII